MLTFSKEGGGRGGDKGQENNDQIRSNYNINNNNFTFVVRIFHL